jgi:putative flippase GtrA
MSKWRKELAFNIRYGCSGLLNTAVGIGAIWMFSFAGLSPVMANVAGYGIGLMVAFLVSRRYVFKSNGHFKHESLKYMLAFCVCYLINILVLQMSLSIFLLDIMLAQGVAVAAYIVSMYVASRLFVF